VEGEGLSFVLHSLRELERAVESGTITKNSGIESLDNYVGDQRHIPRDRRPSTAACSAGWAMGIGDKGIEIAYGERKKYFVLGRLEQPRQNKNLIVPARHDKPNEPTKKGPLSFLLF
jgi:hypothetical protein